MSVIARKHVFGVSEKARLKPVSSATQTSWNSEISLVASFDMILSNKQITNVLIRLCGCAGWSAPLMFANPEDRFSHVEYQIMVCCVKSIDQMKTHSIIFEDESEIT